MVKTLRWCLLTFWITLVPAQAAVLQVDGGGILTGAKSVLVGTQLYDVQFADGKCADIFSPCDVGASFPFDATGAFNASQALLQQVFQDIPGVGQFDSDPGKTFGCQGRVNSECVVYTPYFVGTTMVFAGAAYNVPQVRPDGSGGFAMFMVGIDRSYDSTVVTCVDDNPNDCPDSAWARWTVESAPEPGTIALLSLGLAGLAFTRRRKQ